MMPKKQGGGEKRQPVFEKLARIRPGEESCRATKGKQKIGLGKKKNAGFGGVTTGGGGREAGDRKKFFQKKKGRR